MLENNVCDGNAVDEAGAQVKGGQSSQPAEVALQDSHKAVVPQPVHFVHGVHRFFADRCAALVDGVDLALDKIHGHQTDQEVDDHRDAQQNENCHGKSFNDVFQHGSHPLY